MIATFKATPFFIGIVMGYVARQVPVLVPMGIYWLPFSCFIIASACGLVLRQQKFAFSAGMLTSLVLCFVLLESKGGFVIGFVVFGELLAYAASTIGVYGASFVTARMVTKRAGLRRPR